MPKLRLADKTVHMCAQKRLCCVYWKCIGVFEVSASLIWSSGKPSGTSEYALFKLVPMIWLNHRSLTKVLFSNINITVQKLIRSVQLFLSYGVRGRGGHEGSEKYQKVLRMIWMDPYQKFHVTWHGTVSEVSSTEFKQEIPDSFVVLRSVTFKLKNNNINLS